MDVTRAEYLHFTGQPVPASNICIGRKWILEDADLVSCIRYYRDGALTISGLAWELSWNPGVRLVCGGRHHAVSSYVFAVSQYDLFERSSGRAGAIQIGLGKSGAECRRNPLTLELNGDRLFRIDGGLLEEGLFRRQAAAHNLPGPPQHGSRLDPGASIFRRTARILEVGCGAGLITVALAQNGYTVDALDSTTAMLQMTRNDAAHQGVEDRVRLHAPMCMRCLSRRTRSIW